MINFNHPTTSARLNFYTFKKGIEIIESKNRFAPITLAFFSILSGIAVRTTKVAELFFKGTCHLLASPFSNHFSASTGLSMYRKMTLTLISLTIIVVATPILIPSLSLVMYLGHDKIVPYLKSRFEKMEERLPIGVKDDFIEMEPIENPIEEYS